MMLQAKCKSNPKATKVIKNLSVFQHNQGAELNSALKWDSNLKDNHQEKKEEGGSRKMISKPDRERPNIISSSHLMMRGANRSVPIPAPEKDEERSLDSISKDETFRLQNSPNPFRDANVGKPDKALQVQPPIAISRPATPNFYLAAPTSNPQSKIKKQLKWHIDSEVLLKKPKIQEVMSQLKKSRIFNDDYEIESSRRISNILLQFTSYFEIVIQRLFTENKLKILKQLNSNYIKAIMTEELARDKELLKKEKTYEDSARQTPVSCVLPRQESRRALHTLDTCSPETLRFQSPQSSVRSESGASTSWAFLRCGTRKKSALRRCQKCKKLSSSQRSTSP